MRPLQACRAAACRGGRRPRSAPERPRPSRSGPTGAAARRRGMSKARPAAATARSDARTAGSARKSSRGSSCTKCRTPQKPGSPSQSSSCLPPLPACPAGSSRPPRRPSRWLRAAASIARRISNGVVGLHQDGPVHARGGQLVPGLLCGEAAVKRAVLRPKPAGNRRIRDSTDANANPRARSRRHQRLAPQRVPEFFRHGLLHPGDVLVESCARV